MSNSISQNDDTTTAARTVSGKEQLRFTDEQFIWRFSPNQTDPELLEAIFVGREPLLQNVLEKIADAATSGATHHVLLYGPRGIGKSHFTSLLHHRLLSDAKLSEAVHIAHLNEDETTTSMVQLLVRIYRSLCKAYPDDYSSEWLNELLNQTPDEITGVLIRRLVARFEKRTLVILVENLNLLFENLATAGQHELRTFLQEHPFACLIATSQQLFKAITDRSEPFFGFFQQIPLRPLSLQDAQQLLAKIAGAKGQAELAAFLNTPDGRGRVRAIHDLAGGNHRVYIVLSGFVTRESLDQLVAPFQKMADDLTPYYQERLRWISPMQRQIVELLCSEHRTLNPKEIARRLLVDQRSIGKQVRELVKIGYLTDAKRGRETFYELSEPLMRLAYEVKEQSLLEMLIEFLRIWYRPDQMEELRSAGLSHSTQAYVNAAYERSQTHPDPRLKLLQAELDKAEAEGRSDELAALWEEKAAASNVASDWLQAGYYFDEFNNDYTNAIYCYEKSIELDPEYAGAWNNKGSSLDRLGRYEEALNCFGKAIELDPEDSNPWYNKGASLGRLGQYEESLICSDKAIELDPEDSYAWNNKGTSLNRLGRYEEALNCIVEALELDPKNAAAWNNKGNSLSSLGRSNVALSCFDKAIELDPEDAQTWSDKGIALSKLGRYEKGLSCFANATKLEPESAAAWNNKGNSLSSLGRYEDALSCYNKSLKLDAEYVDAWNGKGNLLNRIDRYEEALDCYDKALELDPEYAFVWVGKGDSLSRLGQYEEALSSYDKSLKLDPESVYAWNGKGVSLDNLGRYEEALSSYDKTLELDPEDAYARFNRSEALFAMHRWDEGFGAIRDALAQPNRMLDYLGDVASMFGLIFRLSEDGDRLQSRIHALVDLYQQAAEERGFRRPDPGAQRRRSGNVNAENEAQQGAAGTALRSVRPTTNPLSHLADGLVKSLAKIQADEVTPVVLESYVTAVEQRAAKIPEFEIPLRLFRYGIRYLVSHKESEFVELIKPERRILRQVLGLEPEE